MNEIEKVEQLRITCFVNMAVTAMKGRIFPLVIEVCDEILKHDPTHIKALYLKSKALVTPKSAGAHEDEVAMKNLKLALKYDPGNKIVM